MSSETKKPNIDENLDPVDIKVSLEMDGGQVDYDLHMHSNASDGEPIYYLMRSAENSELDLIVITDHEDYEDVQDIQGYVDAIKEANNDFNEVDVIAGLELNYETNKNDRYDIAERLEGEGHEITFDKGREYKDEDIEEEKRQKAGIDSIVAPYGSVHDVDGVYIKNEDFFLEKLHEDYLGGLWESIDDIEEVDNNKIREINDQIEVIKESYVDIYTEKVKSLAEEGEPFKFIAHPDLPLRNSIIAPYFTEEHIDEIVSSLKKSSGIPEANGKGVVRQLVNNFGSVIEDQNLSEGEVVEKFGRLIRGENNPESAKGMSYFRKLDEEGIDFVVGSDAHRAPEIEVRNYYFELFKKAMENEPLELEGVKKHLEID